MITRVKTTNSDTSRGIRERTAFEKVRFNLNDLLDRDKEQQEEDRKKNLLIFSLTIFIALGVILVLSFS